MITAEEIEKVRKFNRFYTRLIGLLNEGLFKSEFNLTQARIIFELGETENLGETDGIVAADLSELLVLDTGYLSRVLNGLIKHGLVSKSPNPNDKRQFKLALTKTGENIRKELRELSIADIKNLFANVSKNEIVQIVDAMDNIEQKISAKPMAKTYILRDPEVGDLSYITHRQAVLYHQEYGFDNHYEAVVSAVIGEYIQSFDANYERCWIAEFKDEIVGSIFCVNAGNGVAKLRLLYVDPVARGMGIGAKLITEVIKFARSKKYKKIEFWTVDCLTDAKRLYEAAGFEFISSQPHTEFGTDLNRGAGINRQDWQMIL